MIHDILPKNRSILGSENHISYHLASRVFGFGVTEVTTVFTMQLIIGDTGQISWAFLKTANVELANNSGSSGWILANKCSFWSQWPTEHTGIRKVGGVWEALSSKTLAVLTCIYASRFSIFEKSSLDISESVKSPHFNYL